MGLFFRRPVSYRYDPPAPIALGARAERKPKPRGPLGACPMPARGAFGAALPSSMCVQAQRIEPADLPEELRQVASLPVTSPGQLDRLARLLSHAYETTDREWFLVLVFDARLRLWGWFTAAVGGQQSVQVEVPIILQGVLASGKRSFSLVHNHPSGDPQPSREDIALTATAQQGALLVGLQLVDHLVIGSNGRFTSLREGGFMR